MERRLCRVQQPGRLLAVAPANLVDLRECHPPSPPDDRDFVCLQRGGIECRLDSPGADALAGLLAHLPERDRTGGVETPTRFLAKLASGGRQRIFARLDLPLDDRPRPLLASCPERAARMGDEDLDAARASAVGDQSGALHGPDARAWSADSLSPVQIGPTPAGRHPWGDADTPFEELGGDARVRGLAWAFYDVVEQTSPVLRAMLPRDTTVSREKLYEFLSGWMGGPPLYWERRGHPALRMRHAPFAIDEFAAAEWVRCMREALERQSVEGDLRGFLERELGRVAVQLRNRD
jgi:hemoglobin